MTVIVRNAGGKYEGVHYTGNSTQTLAPDVEQRMVNDGFALWQTPPDTFDTNAMVRRGSDGNLKAICNPNRTDANINSSTKKYLKNELLVDDYSIVESVSGWTVSGNGSAASSESGTFTYDSVNKGVRIRNCGVNAKYIMATKALPASLDATKTKRISVLVKSNMEGLNGQVYILFGNASNTFTTPKTFGLTSNGAYPTGANDLVFQPSERPDYKWVTLDVGNDPNFIALGTVTQIRIRTAEFSAPFLHDFTIQKVVAHNKTKAVFIPTYDDGHDTGFTIAKQHLESVGARGTFFIPTSGAVGVGASLRMTTAQQLQLIASGHRVCADSTHDDYTLADYLTPDAYLAGYLRGASQGVNNGLNQLDMQYICWTNGVNCGNTSGIFPRNNVTATSDGSNVVSLSAAITVAAGAKYYGTNVPDGTTVTTGGINVTSLTLSNNIPAQTKGAATVELSVAFGRNDLVNRFKSAGVKGAGLTLGGNNYPVDGFRNPLDIQRMGVSGQNHLQISEILFGFKERGAVVPTYAHRLVDDPVPFLDTSVNPSINQYVTGHLKMLQLIKTWVDAGEAEFMTFPDAVDAFSI